MMNTKKVLKNKGIDFMIIKNISINSFGVYGGKNNFDFQTDSEKTVILCGGKNGAGKTTLFESVMLCFYGKDFDDSLRQKEYNEKILRSFHKNSKGASQSASISVEFQFAFDGEIREYLVTRKWQNLDGKVVEDLSIKKMISGSKFEELDISVPKKTNRFTDSRFEEIDSVEKSDWQQFINQLIPKGIAKLFFFDGEKIQSIADDGNENQYLQSSFDTLLGLDVVTQLQKDIGLMLSRNSKLNKKDDSALDADYDSSRFDEILATYGNLRMEEITLQYLPLFLKLHEDLTKRIDTEEFELKELSGEIEDKQKELNVTKEKFEKIGGKYFSKYKEMEESQDNVTSKIAITEKEIRDLCSTELPFSLIPQEMDEIKKQIEFDQKIIRSKYEKEILEKNYSKINSLIKSKSFLPEISKELKESLDSEISKFLDSEIKSLNANSKTFFNFSDIDMNRILTMISNSKKDNITKINNLANSYKIQKNALDKMKLVSKITPNDDEIRPLMKQIEKITSQRTRLEEQHDQIDTKHFQNKTLLKSLNFKIRHCMTLKRESEKMSSSENMGSVVMTVLDEYADSLRKTKISELESNILQGLDLLLHKDDFVEKVTVNSENFDVKLWNSSNDEITKDMLSKGELQIYATALVWALAKTSGRSLPFMIDTPLARLDVEHRENIVGSFFPQTSQQTIILSTDSEITSEYYEILYPAISKSYVMEFDDSTGKTQIRPGYFFEKQGDLVVEVQ